MLHNSELGKFSNITHSLVKSLVVPAFIQLPILISFYGGILVSWITLRTEIYKFKDYETQQMQCR